MNKAVFLDRDGVINDNKHPVNKPKDLILFPWTYDALKMLYDAGYMLFVVTNQGGIEMGYFTADDLEKIHEKMLSDLSTKKITIHDIAYCPHFKTKCSCRKPLPGMLLDLAQRYEVDMQYSWMVGDRDMDIEAGVKAGCKTIKIGKSHPEATYTVENLLEAAQYILGIREKVEC
ncbi:MAG: D-glycero-alpha-D-manno-heptose-1,7-bisphosphate 7-phosphatase [Bacillota bacterium]